MSGAKMLDTPVAGMRSAIPPEAAPDKTHKSERNRLAETMGSVNGFF